MPVPCVHDIGMMRTHTTSGLSRLSHHPALQIPVLSASVLGLPLSRSSSSDATVIILDITAYDDSKDTRHLLLSMFSGLASAMVCFKLQWTREQQKDDHRRTRTCNLLVTFCDVAVGDRSQTRYHCAR